MRAVKQVVQGACEVSIHGVIQNSTDRGPEQPALAQGLDLICHSVILLRNFEGYLLTIKTLWFLNEITLLNFHYSYMVKLVLPC